MVKTLLLKLGNGLTSVPKKKEKQVIFLTRIVLCSRKALECDAFGILPNSHGKSLIFEALPYFDNSTIIVIFPLNSIIEEQVRRYGESAINFSDSVITQIASVSTYKGAENDNGVVVVVTGDIL